MSPLQPGCSLISPRLQSLRSGDSWSFAAVEAFWAEIEATGAPLVERDPLDEEVAIVTFLYRALEPLDNVVTIEWITPGDFPLKTMTEIPGAGIWYRSARVASDVRTVYRFSPNDSLVPRHQEPDWETRRQNWALDPLNQNRFFAAEGFSESERAWVDATVLEGPDAPPLNRSFERRTLRGTMRETAITSAILANTRPITIYTPALEKDAPPPGVVIHFDADRARYVLDLPEVIDELASGGHPMIAVMVENVDRHNELPCNPDFARFLADELAPWIRSNAEVSADPGDWVLAGQSYGGLASAFAALSYPDQFGKVLSQSGSFWWKPNPFERIHASVPGIVPEYSWLCSHAATLPPANVRFWIEAGRFETRMDPGNEPTLLESNRHFRDVLMAKGYDVAYSEFPGGHDSIWWRDHLGVGLRSLLSG
ncbi:MAG: DUF3327 domain-containing protein [Thermomicrobiales bacterium]|nr:DUF3327 domain-containing protein [Thermomicrobiales bacterium]